MTNDINKIEVTGIYLGKRRRDERYLNISVANRGNLWVEIAGDVIIDADILEKGDHIYLSGSLYARDEPYTEVATTTAARMRFDKLEILGEKTVTA